MTTRTLEQALAKYEKMQDAAKLKREQEKLEREQEQLKNMILCSYKKRDISHDEATRLAHQAQALYKRNVFDEFFRSICRQIEKDKVVQDTILDHVEKYGRDMTNIQDGHLRIPLCMMDNAGMFEMKYELFYKAEEIIVPYPMMASDGPVTYTVTTNDLIESANISYYYKLTEGAFKGQCIVAIKGGEGNYTRIMVRLTDPMSSSAWRSWMHSFFC